VPFAFHTRKCEPEWDGEVSRSVRLPEEFRVVIDKDVQGLGEVIKEGLRCPLSRAMGTPFLNRAILSPLSAK